MKTPVILLFVITLFLQPASAQRADPRAAATDSLFSRYDTIQTTSISVMVIRKGRILYERSFGLAEIETGRKATPATNYRIASVTKPFTAMAIMMLRDQGKLSLDDPLSKFFPKTAAYGNQVTVRQMLNHTSGLLSYSSLIPPGTTVPLKDEDVLHMLEKQDSTRFKPGERFSYSNTAYVLLGLIVEQVSGMPFARFLEQRIFRPLKMTNTKLNSLTGDIPDRAYGYNLKNGKLLREDQNLTSYLLGDGGIYSSIRDFYQWDQALYKQKLVKRKTMKEIFTPSSWETPVVAYGYGWYLEKKHRLERVSHSGGTTGFSSYFARYPEKKFSIIIFANQDDGLALAPFADAVEKIYLEEAR